LRTVPPVRRAILTAWPVSCLAAATSDDLTPEERAWLEGDELQATTTVNEGQLEFLTAPPDEQVHHHHNHIVIDADSVKGGWVRLVQCHAGLDAVPRAEILFRQGRVRNLQVDSSDNIGLAWVEGATVQLGRR